MKSVLRDSARAAASRRVSASHDSRRRSRRRHASAGTACAVGVATVERRGLAGDAEPRRGLGSSGMHEARGSSSSIPTSHPIGRSEGSMNTLELLQMQHTTQSDTPDLRSTLIASIDSQITASLCRQGSSGWPAGHAHWRAASPHPRLTLGPLDCTMLHF